MGFLDFFKSKKVAESSLKKVGFSEACLLLDVKLGEEKKKVGDIERKIGEKVVEFVFGLKNRINVLNLIDLEKKRESEKIKFVTMEGLKKYIEQLDKFVENLRKTDKEMGFSLRIREINVAFDLFLRSSRKRFHQATILIGEELAETEKMIRAFHKEINLIAENGIESALKVKKINDFKVFWNSFYKTKKVREGIRDLILDLKREKEKIVGRKKRSEKEFGLFLKSDEFKNWIGRKENLEKEMGDFVREVGEMRKKIDFKFLLKKFHGVKGEELVRGYRDNFLKMLEEDEELRILELLDEEQRKSVAGEIERARSNIIRLNKEGNLYLVNKKSEAFEETIRKMDYEIAGVEEKIEREDRKMKKFDEKVSLLRGEIVEMIENVLNVEVDGNV